MENNLPHRSGAKSTLCNVAIKVSLLSLHIFIHTCPFCFLVTWCPSATSIFLSVSSNEPGIKSENFGIIWNIALEHKIQLVYFKLSPKSILWDSSLSDIRAIDSYIFWSLLFSPLSNSFCDTWLPLSLKRTCFRSF